MRAIPKNATRVHVDAQTVGEVRNVAEIGTDSRLDFYDRHGVEAPMSQGKLIEDEMLAILSGAKATESVITDDHGRAIASHVIQYTYHNPRGWRQ